MCVSGRHGSRVPPVSPHLAVARGGFARGIDGRISLSGLHHVLADDLLAGLAPFDYPGALIPPGPDRARRPGGGGKLLVRVGLRPSFREYRERNPARD